MRLKNGVVLNWQRCAVVVAVFIVGTAFGFCTWAASVWIAVRFLQWIGAL